MIFFSAFEFFVSEKHQLNRHHGSTTSNLLDSRKENSLVSALQNLSSWPPSEVPKREIFADMPLTGSKAIYFLLPLSIIHNIIRKISSVVLFGKRNLPSAAPALKKAYIMKK